MLIKNILIGLLVFLFCIGLAGMGIAGDNEKPYASRGDNVSSMNTENHNIEFDYSPMMASGGLASVSHMKEESEVIEFDYSPRERSSLASSSSMNTDSEEIQFDYSPRPVNCGTPYC